MLYTELTPEQRFDQFQYFANQLLERYQIESSLLSHYLGAGANRRQTLDKKLAGGNATTPTYTDLTVVQFMLLMAGEGSDPQLYRFNNQSELYKFVRSAKEQPMQHNERVPSYTLTKEQRSQFFHQKVLYLEQEHGMQRRHFARLIAAGANKRMEIDKRLAPLSAKWARPPSYSNLAVVELMRFLADTHNLDWRRASFTIDGVLADAPKKGQPARTLDPNSVAQ